MEEEERREAAIETKAAALQPDFKSQRVTKDQLNKFKELHRRRLEIKERSKIHKNPKGKNLSSKKIRDELEDPKPSTMNANSMDASIGTKKRQKLHWGLDTKERWERKSNM